MSRDRAKARESIPEDDLAKTVSLSLHNSFCLNRELKVKGFTKSGNEVAGAEGVDAILRAIESMGRDRDQL